MLRAQQVEASPSTQPGERTPAAAAATPPPRNERNRAKIAGALLFLLIAAFLLPPLINISRYQHRVAASLSLSFGRPVQFGRVRLLLLPRPALSISNLTVDETAAFGAEPLLECANVTASLRLLSLWRGRFEISRIALDEPSFNLQRNAQGYWNIGSVLTEASRTSAAPTAQIRPGHTLRFPYIEATGARINFKYGDEKKPFSLQNADIAIWLNTPEEWRIRFRAQPMRTDINLSAADTGIVRVDGAIQRTAAVGALPLDLNAQWEKAPLGQISRMLTGEDAGWRADMDLRAHVGGTPDHLVLHLAMHANDFHRAEYVPANALRLGATCDATYIRAEHLWSGISCLAPAGHGAFQLSGELGRPDSELTVGIVNAPAEAFLEWLRHVHRGSAQSPDITGDVNGHFTVRGAGTGTDAIAGGAILSGGVLQSTGNAGPLNLPDLHWTALAGTAPLALHTRGGPRTLPPSPPVLLLQPVAIRMGGTAPLTVDGRFTSRDFAMHYTGSAALARLLPLMRGWNVIPGATASLAPNGSADFNLTLAGPWITPVQDADAPALSYLPSGSVTLHNARLQTEYLATPLNIASAQGAITPQEIAWSGVDARLGDLNFLARFRMPLSCAQPLSCVRHFDISMGTLDLQGLREDLRGRGNGAIVQALLNRMEPRKAWPPLDGTLRAGRLTVRNMAMQNVTVSLTLADGELHVASFDGRALGGSVHGSGSMALSATPKYAADVQLTGVDVRGIAALFGEHWGNGGMGNLAAHLKLTGTDTSALTKSATGTVHWDWGGGGWPQLAGTALADFNRWTVDGNLAGGVIAITYGLLTNGATIERLTGTVTLKRELDVQLDVIPPVAIRGTLSEPTVPAQNTD